MKIKLAGILILLLSILSVGQDRQWPTPKDADYPKINLQGKGVKDFIPKGFDLISQVSGDLNGDRLTDIALHIKGNSARFITKLDFNEYDTNPRILLILFREHDRKGYRLAEQSNKFITTPESPANSEPFQGMSIKNGILQIDLELWLSAGGWGATNASYKFRYQDGHFFLIGADREDYMRNSIETYKESYNFLTGKVKSTAGMRKDVGNPRAKKSKSLVSWRPLQNVGLRDLKDLGPAFSWEIQPGYFL